MGKLSAFYFDFRWVDLERKLCSSPGMGKKGKVKSNPHSKIDPIMPGH
jgi:hypothetical protein